MSMVDEVTISRYESRKIVSMMQKKPSLKADSDLLAVVSTCYKCEKTKIEDQAGYVIMEENLIHTYPQKHTIIF